MIAPFPLLRAALPGRIRVVDVGAYRGDFTAAVLASFPGSSAWLLPPALTAIVPPPSAELVPAIRSRSPRFGTGI